MIYAVNHFTGLYSGSFEFDETLHTPHNIMETGLKASLVQLRRQNHCNRWIKKIKEERITEKRREWKKLVSVAYGDVQTLFIIIFDVFLLSIY